MFSQPNLNYCILQTCW